MSDTADDEPQCFGKGRYRGHAIRCYGMRGHLWGMRFPHELDPEPEDAGPCDDYEPADGDPGGCAHCAAVDSEHADMKGYSSD